MTIKEIKQKEVQTTESSSSTKLDDKSQKTKTMSLSIKEGSFGGLTQNLANQFITPYAINLNVSPTQLGIMSSLLGIIPPIGQIYGSHLMKKQSRRSLMLKGVISQSLVWPLIILLGYFSINNWIVSFLPIFLISFYIIYSFLGSIIGPSWFSLMGDIVPDDRRGRFFSKRNLLTTVITIIVSIFASIVLQRFENLNTVFLGFFIIFSIAFTSRIISIFYLARHYDPPFKIEKKSYVSLPKFLRQIPKTNFGKFTLYLTFFYFMVHIGAPFVGYYMLEELNFNYIEYVAVNLSTPLLSLIFYPIIGFFSDKYGSSVVLRICGFILPSVPILWIFMNTPLQLIFGPQLVSALAWTGVNLSASTFIYDNISNQQRGFYISYFNFFIGIGVLLGGFLGSFLLQIVPIIFISVFETLFLISGTGRLTVNLIFLFRLKEVRVQKVKVIGSEN